MEFSYGKEEKLKSKKLIEALFIERQSVAKYPLRLAFKKLETEDVNLNKSELQVAVSVSKKHFKKAVDRNYFKRVLRENYRLNKHLILDKISGKYALMLLYQTKDRLTYEEINEKTIQLFEKFVAKVNNPQ
ncbi:ribonuclease P protein component [Flavobacterium ardleyense]|uniref:ribonuclease P protein component n=1 Tax=Flavobacterium ardleyense TaxID=2038737 RepID=UPI00298C2082|nr:ribonuclease P protein component [Flavobacterium ardleyense]